MHVPVDELSNQSSFSCTGNGDFFGNVDLSVELHPHGHIIAAAARSELVLLKVLSSPSGLQASGPPDGSCGAESTGRSSSSSSRAAHVSTAAASSHKSNDALIAKHVCANDSITAVAWVSFAGLNGHNSYDHGSYGTYEAPAWESRQPAGAAADAAPAPCCLLIGTASGCIQLHDQQGAVLLRQRLHGTPVKGIRLRTASMGLSPGTLCPNGAALVDVCVVYADCVARIAADELLMAFHSCQAAQAERQRQSRHAPSGLAGALVRAAVAYASGPEVPPLQYVMWELPRGVRARSDALCWGQRPRDLYALLQGIASSAYASAGSSGSQQQLVLLTAGEQPCLAAFDVQTQAARGTLGMLVNAATSITSGVYSLAKTAGSQVTSGPRALRQGLREFVLAPLFSSPTAATAAAQQRLQQPLAVYEDPATAGPRPEAVAGTWRVVQDTARTITALSPAPRGPLIASVDNLGRVLLVDGAHMGVLRMWKGYRDAQCGWVELTSATLATHIAGSAEQATCSSSQRAADSRAIDRGWGSSDDDADDGYDPADGEGCAADGGGIEAAIGGGTDAAASNTALLLAIYAPKRQVLELWAPPHGPRITQMRVGPYCRMLHMPQYLPPTPAGVGAAGSAGGGAASRNCGSGCFLLDGTTGELSDVATAMLGAGAR